MNSELSLFPHFHDMFTGMDNNSEQEAQTQLEVLMESGFVQSKQQFERLRPELAKHPTAKNLIALWAEEFRPTRGEFDKDLKDQTGVFSEGLIDAGDPRDNLSFWLKNALKPRPNLESSIWNEAKNRRYDVSTQKAEEFRELEDKSKATTVQQLSSLIETIANIDAIMPIMTDVYPGLEWQAIAEAREAMSTLVAEISKGKHVVLDINTKVYVPRLGRSVAVPIITTMFIASFILAACGAQPVDAGGNGSHETLVVAATQTSEAQNTPVAPTPRTVAPSPIEIDNEPYRGAEFTVGEDGTISVEGTPIPRSTLEAPSPTPLPPDFTVANWMEFRTKILPYCYVRADLSSNKEGLDKVWAELQGTETYDILKGRLDRGEIFTFGTAVVAIDSGGGCGIVTIWSDVNTKSGALFQSRLDPNMLIEVEFTSPTAN